MPLDLFDEAGIAVRLQAVAEAAAGVQLGIGLAIEDFLALAGNDPRLRGAPLELLKIFLDELTVQGGVMAKAAAAAMAYANLVATGSFIKRGSRLPGFTIAAEAGVGLKAGAGFRVFARFGVDDPRNLVGAPSMSPSTRRWRRLPRCCPPTPGRCWPKRPRR